MDLKYLSYQDKISALILAAGLSSRMGQFKPLMSLGDRTVLASAIQPFRAAGIEDVRVVTGYRASDLSPLLERLNIREVHNENYNRGMISSVKAGIESLEAEREAFFLLPVDIPLIKFTTIIELMAAYQPGNAHILYPVFQGRRGHPPLISTRYVQPISSWEGEDGGLRSFLKQYEHKAMEVPVADECILLDIDSMPDYLKLTARLKKHEIPTANECLALLRHKFKAKKSLIDHSRTVARVAGAIGEALQHRGHPINLDLLAAAAFLHDIARQQPEHAFDAFQTLHKMGCPGVAEIVRYHMDIIITDTDFITEKEVLYLSDKIVRGRHLVPLVQRFNHKKEQHKASPEALAAISRRLSDARSIYRRIETIAQQTMDSILNAKGLFFTQE